MNTHDDVAKFMKAAGQETHEEYIGFFNSQSALYMDLCKEEFFELNDAFKDFDPVEVADAAADLIWVVLGLCHSVGIPIQEVWDEVARSNLAKISADGLVHKNANGKVMKPEGWTPPELFPIVMREEDDSTTS